MVKRWARNASAHINVVSAPLTFKALAIAVVPWSPISFSSRLRPQEKGARCQEMVKGWSRDGQGLAPKEASAHDKSVSAPLNFRASPIAVAPWTPISLSPSHKL
eukprot:7207213-Prymnesium_polylepis.1